ncbi:hypothetical protein P4N68_05125 [Corynebacterium felinum]|uniref:Uncharacterized protein n=1 Tax=Corynebacterium felinum TaxID=131318 RepID=A0ABU2BBY6_9CORY|nr:hypothetical protein [Corynebacterium felinum]MDF5820461.1 hypothetical protein [Corynebacterium felinum]MDR7355499.1 hypothetical protein [Corynebacterium felinum]
MTGSTWPADCFSTDKSVAAFGKALEGFVYSLIEKSKMFFLGSDLCA